MSLPVPPATGLTERLVAAYRAFNERLDWVDDPGALDVMVRGIVAFHLDWTWREYPESWPAMAIEEIAISLQNELAEELTEPWPLLAADRPPGKRIPPEPHVRIEGATVHISYGPFALDPIALTDGWS